MKLRQGNSVSTAAITEENFQKVIDAFRMSGCKINAFFNAQNVKYFSFLEWHLDALCKTNEISNFDLLLTVEQILGADDKPHFDFSRRPDSGKNDWYERGDRPPVGAICEAKINHGHWRWEHVEILMHSKKSEKECGTYCENLGILAWSDEFRTIQTEDRKKAIDEMLKIAYTPDVINNRTIMGALYDAGFRKEGK